MVPLGINLEGYDPGLRFRSDCFTVGYFARVAPEKGLHLLAESYIRLRRETDFGGAVLEAAGYLAPEHRGYLRGIEKQMKDAGFADEFRYRGELDRVQQDRFSARPRRAQRALHLRRAEGALPCWKRWPTAFPWCSRGAERFRRCCERTGGGILVEPDNAGSLAEAIPRCGRTASGSRNWGGAARRESASTTASRRWRRGRSRSTATSLTRPSQLDHMLEISDVTKEYPTPRGPLTVLAGVSLS